MEIRPLTDEDGELVIPLWHRAGLTRPWNPPQQDFARALAGPSSAVLGGFESDALVATAMVGHDGHRGWVYYVAVDDEHRRAGLGREIMAAAERWLSVHGVVKVQLMVRADNTAIGSFYDGLGYEDVGARVYGKWLS